MKLFVGSTNPVKVGAATQVLSSSFPEHNWEVQGWSAPSGVAAQPMSQNATRAGAINRVNACREAFEAEYPEAWFVAFEGGVDCFDDGPVTFAYVACYHRQRWSVNVGPHLPLPESVYHSLLAGEELGSVMDRLFHTHNIKQKGGAIGQLTRGHASRQSIYEATLTLALAPFHYPDWYPTTR